MSRLESEYLDLVGYESLTSYQRRLMQEVNYGLTNFVKNLLSSFEADGFTDEVIAGYSPNEQACAHAHRARHGYIILINEGLVQLSLVATILLASRLELLVGGRKLGAICTIDEAHAAYVDALDRVTRGEEIEPLPLLLNPELRNRHAQSLHTAIIEFAIAHEFAHIINGDLDGDCQAKELPGILEPNRYASAWEKEWETDAKGVALLRTIYEERVIYLWYAGAIILFEIADSQRRYLAILGGSGVPNNLVMHPAPRSRRAEIFQRMPLNEDLAIHNQLQRYLFYFCEVAYAIPFEPEENEEQLQILLECSKKHDHEDFDAENLGANFKGENIIFGVMKKRMGRGKDYAQSFVSHCAMRHYLLGEFRSSRTAFILGLSLLVYATLYGRDSDFHAFIQLIRKCIPTIDHINEDVAAVAELFRLLK